MKKYSLPVIAGVAACVALAGCSSSTPANDSKATSPSGSATTGSTAKSTESSDKPAPTAGSEVDKGQFIDDMTQAATDAKTYTMTMEAGAGTQKLTANGKSDLSDPKKPKISLDMVLGETPLSMIMMDGVIYMKMGAMTGNKWLKLTTDQLAKAAPGMNLDMLTNPTAQVMSKDAVNKVVYLGAEGGLAHYRMSVDSAKTSKALGQTTPPAGMPAVLDYDIWLGSDHLMRKMSMNVGGSPMVVTADNWGKPVSIAAPPAAEVVAAPAS